MKSLFIILSSILIVTNLFSQNEVIGDNNVEKNSFYFFSRHILKELEFVNCKKIYFKGETEPFVTSINVEKDDVLVFELDSMSKENLQLLVKEDSLAPVKIEIDKTIKKHYKIKNKKRDDYELQIYRSKKIGNDYLTKLVISNKYKGAVILILIKDEKFTYEISGFIF